MKSLLNVVAAVAVVCGFAAVGSAADWTYNSSTSTITDGTSILKVTVAKNTTDITISTGHTAVGEELDFSEMEGDHITPWRDGGRTVKENCQMLCRECNRRKGAK